MEEEEAIERDLKWGISSEELCVFWVDGNEREKRALLYRGKFQLQVLI